MDLIREFSLEFPPFSLPERVGDRDGRHEGLRVGVKGFLHNVLRPSDFDHLPEIHDADPIADG